MHVHFYSGEKLEDMLKLFGLRSKKIYVLMHKDVAVLAGDYDLNRAGFNEITEVYSFDHVPFSARVNDQVSLEALNHWLRWRGIPGYRVGLDRLLSRLHAESPRQLLTAYYGLSVSDHYWLREEKDTFSYESVNFFHHKFDQDGFAKAMFAASTPEVHASALRTPNSTLAGYQKKAWFHRGSELVLLKGGTFLCQLEPIHEAVASAIAERLGMDAVQYSVEIYENQLVSTCANMLDMHHELITADDVLAVRPPDPDVYHYKDYLKILKNMGIANAKKAMEDMIVLDFIMMNTDRHNQNFGVIINADTMQWEKIAPIFDTGTGLACLRPDNEVSEWSKNYRYRLFNARDVNDAEALSLVSDLKRYDFTAIYDIPEMYARLMYKYRAISNISEKRIRDQAFLLKGRIELIRKYQSGRVK